MVDSFDPELFEMLKFGLKDARTAHEQLSNEENLSWLDIVDTFTCEGLYLGV